MTNIAKKGWKVPLQSSKAVSRQRFTGWICNGGLLAAGLLLVAMAFATPAADTPIPVPVLLLSSTPKLDGDLGDWPADKWLKISIQPALDGDKENTTGKLDVQLQIGISDGKIFVAARWADDAESSNYRPWQWKWKKYKRSKARDDMFALRFDMEGDFHRCMVADSDYKVDVWLWQAGRSAKAGHAEDTWHLITTQPIEDAVEFESPTGKTVYIKKYRDEGNKLYRYTRPKRNKRQGDVLPGVAFDLTGSGSLADVRAAGTWSNGQWQLEMVRALNTGHADDVELKRGQSILGQIAVFNNNYAEHKSISVPLLFQLP